MKNENTDYSSDAASNFRLAGLDVLTSKLHPLKRGEAIKIYYTYLVSSLIYISALQDDGKDEEAKRIMREVMRHINKSPVNLDKLFKKTHFLKDIKDKKEIEKLRLRFSGS